jgi:hydroxymethylpyrimidine pyrophosphatase-like HAD family hydrolase
MSENSGCVAFVDLDDTLFSSLRRQRLAEELVPAATLIDGSVICYTNPAQRALYGMLVAAANVIPVTARNIAAFRRVQLRFKGATICSHGATILRPDGHIDREWGQAMEAPLAAARDALKDFVAMAGRLVDSRGGSLRTWLVDDGGDPAYAVIKHPAHDHEAIQSLADTAVADWLRANPGFRLHVNGNNLAVLPPGVGKAVAVAHIVTRLRDQGLASVVMGAADSNTDHEFLDQCDIIIMPTRSQLGDSLRQGVTEWEAARASV